MNDSSGTAAFADRHLREAIERISDQLCKSASDGFNGSVQVYSRDRGIQKLEQLINLVLAAARRSAAAPQPRNHEEDDTRMREIDDYTRMRAVVEAVADAMITLNENGVIESFNPAACEMFGYTAEEAIGKDYRTMMPAEQVAQFDEDLQQYVDTTLDSVRSIRREVVRIRKDGAIFPMESHARSLKLSERRLIVVVGRDITERKMAEAQLAALTESAMEASRQAGMAELATGVLHNVGNVLNSVNVSTTVLTDKVRKSRMGRVAEISELLTAHAGELCHFLIKDEKGKRLPGYLAKLAEHLADEQAVLLAELGELAKNIEHIKNIVHTQQAHARVFGVVESVSLAEIVNDALTITASSFDRYGIQLVREFADVPKVAVDKQRLLQILVNLIRNAKHAVLDSKTPQKQLVVRISLIAAGRAQIDVIDNGVGIPEENLIRIFAHGFTTKKDGHGFGLHSSALAAKELGGSLAVESEGPDRGAMFTLVLPVRPAEIVQGLPLKMLAMSPLVGAAT